MKNRLALLLAGALLSGSVCFSQAMPEDPAIAEALGMRAADLSMDPQGGFTLGPLDMHWQFFGAGWHVVHQDKNTYKASPVKTENGVVTQTGVWTVLGKPVDVVSTLKRTEPSVYEYTASIKARADDFPAYESITFAANFQERGAYLARDGKPYSFPLVHREVRLVTSKSDALSFAGEKGLYTIEAPQMPFMLQDNYQWGPTYTVRITPKSPAPNERTFSCKISFTPDRFQTIDIKNALNSTYIDEKAHDDQGGWTDQGGENDLRAFKPGRLNANNVPFLTVDPKTNNGKAIINLASRDQRVSFLSTEATIQVPPSDLKMLYLLHTSGWTPSNKEEVGKMLVTYQDGTTGEIPVRSGVDVGNWWLGGDLPNGGIVWQTQNPSSQVGLYASTFELPKPAKSITFRVSNGFWMIFAATLGSRKITFTEAEIPLVIQEGNTWAQLDFNRNTIPGSPLDFSGANHTPAGKYGWMVVDKNGHFSFENAPEQTIRLHGPNLCFSANTIKHEDADELVRKLVRNGYNTIRFHHAEREFSKKAPAKSTDLRPEQIDNFHYLINACKKAGLYITLDLYCSRTIVPADGITDIDEFTGYEMKALAPISKAAMDNWKEYCRVLLLTPNQYTGLPMAQDPCVAFLDLMNEDGTIVQAPRFPKVLAIYDRLWAEYKAKNNIDEKKYPYARLKWLNDLQIKCIQEMTRFLREEIKTKALITDLNWISTVGHALCREYLDVVDNHQYHDHPSFPEQKWRLPNAYRQQSAVKAAASIPRSMMAARVYGKPYTVTEWNYCNPNIYRVQQAALVGGYAALQDWDGLYRFAWSHGANGIINLTGAGGFDCANDPAAQLADRIIWALFIRGDVQTAKGAIASRIRSEQLAERGNGGYPNDFSLLGLNTRIGTLINDNQFQNVPSFTMLDDNWKQGLSADLKAALDSFSKTGKAVSSTGEITLDTRADSIAIDTPRSQVLACSKDAQGGLLAVKGVTHPQSFALISLDGQPVQSSKKMLFIHLANIANKGMSFRNQQCTILTQWGSRPLLIHRADVLVSIKMPAAKVQALNLDGSVNSDVPASVKDGALQFHANNAARKGGTLCYLITR